MDRMISMVMNMVMRKFVSKGINAGIDQASKLGNRKKKKPLAEDHMDQQDR
jgi:hypothetical protein